MRLRLWIASFYLGVCLLAQPTMAGQIEDADAASSRADYTTAIKLLAPLAKNGNAIAQAKLGDLYHYGWGVSEDNAEAAKWYHKAADQGDVYSQMSLANLYYFGSGVLQDYQESLKWWRIAAEKSAIAQLNLGADYYSGAPGTTKNLVDAYMWLNLASANFHASDAVLRDQAIKMRNDAASRMTAEQIAEGQRLAGEWQAMHPMP